jgi:hypothetical protein
MCLRAPTVSTCMVKSLPRMAENSGTACRGVACYARMHVEPLYPTLRAATVRERLLLWCASSDSGHAPLIGCGSSASGGEKCGLATNG